MWINDKPVNELPIAPLVKKDNIPAVCQTDNFFFKGEVITRATFQVFVEGILHQFIAEHNARSLSTSLEIDEKIEKQWDGLKLDQIAETPYTFYF